MLIQTKITCKNNKIFIFHFSSFTRNKKKNPQTLKSTIHNNSNQQTIKTWKIKKIKIMLLL